MSNNTITLTSSKEVHVDPEQYEEARSVVLGHVEELFDRFTKDNCELQISVEKLNSLVVGIEDTQLRDTVMEMVSKCSRRIESIGSGIDEAIQRLSVTSSDLENSAYNIDPISGLPTLETAKELVKKEQILHGKNYPISIAIVDVDHFSRINEGYKKTNGDLILRYIGTIVKNTTKGSDIVASAGGAKYLVILPGTNLVNGCIVGGNIRRSISELDVKQKNGRSIGKITVSIGAANVHYDEHLEKAIERAEGSLSRAKEHGRDRLEYDPR